MDVVLLGLPPNPPSVTWDRIVLPATQRKERVRERERAIAARHLTSVAGGRGEA